MSATKNIGASVRARLLNRGRADNVDFNLMLTRYALECLLYRLSVSEWANEFLLKGGFLFDLWFDQPQRTTRDIDLLGFGPAGLEHLTTAFQEICREALDDGIEYEQASVRVWRFARCQLRRRAYPLLGTLDGARCAI
jgi:predicted nucleotidyltransferase component of viral defense system